MGSPTGFRVCNVQDFLSFQGLGIQGLGFRLYPRKLEHNFKMISAGIPYSLPGDFGLGYTRAWDLGFRVWDLGLGFRGDPKPKPRVREFYRCRV